MRVILDDAVCLICSLVRDLRALYMPFGSTSSKSAKIGTNVHTSISAGRQEWRPLEGRHFDKNQNGRQFSPTMYDTTF